MVKQHGVRALFYTGVQQMPVAIQFQPDSHHAGRAHQAGLAAGRVAFAAVDIGAQFGYITRFQIGADWNWWWRRCFCNALGWLWGRELWCCGGIADGGSG